MTWDGKQLLSVYFYLLLPNFTELQEICNGSQGRKGTRIEILSNSEIEDGR